MPRWTREPDADQRVELEITGFKNGLYKSREDAAKSHGIDPNTLRNLTKSRILNNSDCYPLQNLQLCDSVYTLQPPAFLLEFNRSELLRDVGMNMSNVVQSIE